MEAIKLEDYEIDVLIQGFPGRMVCHGGLGWSTIALIRGRGHVALVDVGSFSMRKGLIAQLAKRGLEPADVTTSSSRTRITITRSTGSCSARRNHHRRKRARLVDVRALGRDAGARAVHTRAGKLAFAATRRGRAGMHARTQGVRRARAHPGHLVFVLEGKVRDVIFTGDAAKNRAELLSRRGEATYDAALSAASIERICSCGEDAQEASSFPATTCR